MSKRIVVIADADAIIAQTDPQDLHHQKALEITKSLVEQNAQVLYPITAITEAVTHLQRALSSSASAYGTAVIFAGTETSVVEVNHDVLRQAVKYFSPTASKKNTLFDCIVIVVAKKYQADAVFSFDKFYKKQGLKLASEL